jgi:hypothetical protein
VGILRIPLKRRDGGFEGKLERDVVCGIGVLSSGEWKLVTFAKCFAQVVSAGDLEVGRYQVSLSIYRKTSLRRISTMMSLTCPSSKEVFEYLAVSSEMCKVVKSISS